MSQYDPGMSPEDFQPRPGGLIDTARKEKAKLEAMAHAKAEKDAEPGPAKRYVIPVKTTQPNLFAPKTVTIGAGASIQALPADPGRMLAVMNLISVSGQVTIARDRASADSGTGYVLQAGNPPIPMTHTREVWLNNPGTASVQVSVLSESYSGE